MTTRRRISRFVPRLRRGGFTLLEAMISTVIISILMGAMFSVMLIAARSLGGDGEAEENAFEGRQAVEQVTADLQLANRFLVAQPWEVEFTVPDRDGDGQDETIRYAWSGRPGDPLTRRYNGGGTVAVAENVNQFDLTYLTEAP